MHGVAMDNFDIIDGYTETIADYLCERRLVSLALRLTAGKHRDRAGGMKSDLA